MYTLMRLDLNPPKIAIQEFELKSSYGRYTSLKFDAIELKSSYGRYTSLKFDAIEMKSSYGRYTSVQLHAIEWKSVCILTQLN